MLRRLLLSLLLAFLTVTAAGAVGAAFDQELAAALDAESGAAPLPQALADLPQFYGSIATDVLPIGSGPDGWCLLGLSGCAAVPGSWWSLPLRAQMAPVLEPGGFAVAAAAIGLLGYVFGLRTGRQLR